MKKTMTKSLSVLLAILMIFSTFSAVMFANAADEEAAKQEINATYMLDAVDKMLAEQDLNSQLSLPSALTNVLKLMGITIKLNSVNEICTTLNSVAKSSLVNTLLKTMGDLKNVNLSVWKTKYSRGTEAKDIAIIAAVVNFAKDNTTIVHKFLSGKLDIGALGDIKIDGKTLNDTINGVLGEGGVCAKLKGLLAGLVYDEGSAEYTACVAKSLDSIIFEDLATVGVKKGLKMADDTIIEKYVGADKNEVWTYVYETMNFRFENALDNFKYDSSATLDGFVAGLANAIYKYLQPYLDKLCAEYGDDVNELLAGSGAYGAPFAKLLDFTKFKAVDFTAKSVKDVNKFIGTLVMQMCDFKWDNSKNLGENFQNIFMWAIQNRDKTVEGDPYVGVTGSNFADYALSLAKMIVTNVVGGDDRDTVVAKMNSCKNATEVLTILLPYLLNRGDATIISAKSTTYEQVLGDLVGYYLNGLLPLYTDAGRTTKYVPGSSKTIWEVLNYVANYYLVDLNVDAIFGINMTKDSTFLAKLDQVQATLFAGLEYTKASSYIPALLKDVLALDAKSLVGNEIEKNLVNQNATTPAAQMVCTVVNNLYKSILNNNLLNTSVVKATTSAAGTLTYKCALCGKTVATCTTPAKIGTMTLAKSSYAYTGKAIQPAVTVKDANGNVIAASNYTVAYKNNINAGTATATVTFKNSYSGTLSKTFKITAISGAKFKATASNVAYTGKAVAPKVVVKDTAGKVVPATNYTVSVSAKTVGTATATIKFKANYTGAITVKYNIVPAQVKSVKASKNAKDSVTISWAKVTGAKYYKVEQSTDGKKWTVVSAATTATTLTVKKLKANTKYQYRVTAMDSTKKLIGAASAVVKTGTLTAAPTVTLKSTKKATATASWKSVSGATKFVVYKSTDGKKWTKVTTTKNAKTTSYTLTKLTAGKVIYVKVASVNAYGESASAVAKVTVKK